MSALMNLEAVEYQPASQKIAKLLRQLIVNRDIKPGERLHEGDLAEQLNVSRSPVREAIQLLTWERLLVKVPNKGVVVASFTHEDVAEIYSARAAIETFTGKWLCQQEESYREAVREKLANVLERLSVAVDKGDLFEISELDQEFHTTLVNAGNNARLSRSYQVLSTEALVCINWLEIKIPSGKELIDDHETFITLIKDGNEQKLVAELEEHLISAGERLANLLDSFE